LKCQGQSDSENYQLDYKKDEIIMFGVVDIFASEDFG
jgi:hypothetical protein